MLAICRDKAVEHAINRLYKITGVADNQDDDIIYNFDLA